MLYRPYAPQDFDRLYALEEACFQPTLRFSQNAMRRLVQRLHAATWIAEENGRMAGFAIVEWSDRRHGIVAYIQTIEVAREARGQGVGSELLGYLEESARLAGAGLIWLHVEASNEVAIRLYKRLGYHSEGMQEDYYPQNRPALIYMKRLGKRVSSGNIS